MSTPVNITITKQRNIKIEKLGRKIPQLCMHSPKDAIPCGLHCPQVSLSKDYDGQEYLYICQGKTIRINKLVVEG